MQVAQRHVQVRVCAFVQADPFTNVQTQTLTCAGASSAGPGMRPATSLTKAKARETS